MSKVIKLHKNPGGVRILRAGRQDVAHPSSAPAAFAALDEAGGVKDDAAPTVMEEPLAPPPSSRNLAVEEYERGFRDGKEATETIFREKYQTSLAQEQARVDELLTRLTEQIASFQEKAEQTAIRFSLAVAGLIVKREVILDEEIVLREIKEALRRILGAERVTIHVHPSEEECVRNHRASIASGHDSIREILFEGDDNVPPGGCIIESGAGNVDARIETQIKKIEAVMLGPL